MQQKQLQFQPFPNLVEVFHIDTWCRLLQFVHCLPQFVLPCIVSFYRRLLASIVLLLSNLFSFHVQILSFSRVLFFLGLWLLVLPRRQRVLTYQLVLQIGVVVLQHQQLFVVLHEQTLSILANLGQLVLKMLRLEQVLQQEEEVQVHHTQLVHVHLFVDNPQARAQVQVQQVPVHHPYTHRRHHILVLEHQQQEHHHTTKVMFLLLQEWKKLKHFHLT
mmetsp:Transcript_2867/g.4079  ORF Transcript_2867/g.4079 Transcript_2867/m.4079 type:complete len:218 (+) Transcript_2867:541-1194(+)